VIEPQGHGLGVVPGEASDGIEPGPQPALPTEMGPEPQPGLFLWTVGNPRFPDVTPPSRFGGSALALRPERGLAFARIG